MPCSGHGRDFEKSWAHHIKTSVELIEISSKKKYRSAFYIDTAM
jgi:hypothetical protein